MRPASLVPDLQLPMRPWMMACLRSAEFLPSARLISQNFLRSNTACRGADLQASSLRHSTRHT